MQLEHGGVCGVHHSLETCYMGMLLVLYKFCWAYKVGIQRVVTPADINLIQYMIFYFVLVVQ